MAAVPVGVIGNPASHGNRAWRSEALRAVAARYEHVMLAEPRTREGLADALRGFREAGVALVAVSGGDGTLREVLTALPRAWPGPPPELALLPAGKTDVAAGDVGGAGYGALGLARLLDAIERGAPLRREERPVLEVHWPGTANPPLRGFLFGAAAFSEGHRLANARLHSGGVFGKAAVGLTVAAMLARAAVGGRGKLANGQRMALTADGAPLPLGRRFLVLATTLERLTLGLWPFRDTGAGPLHWLDMDAPPRRLARGVWAALRPTADRGWMEAAGHRSGRAERLRVKLAVPFVLDGEAYAPGPEGVELCASGRQRFVCP